MPSARSICSRARITRSLLSASIPRKAPLAAAKKENYIKSLGKPEAAAGWHFLTSSDPTAGHTLGDAIGFGYCLDPKTDNYVHQTGIYLCTSEGKVSRVELGSKYDPDALRDSLINASQGKISSGLFGVALACGFVHFDADSGKYTLVVVNVVRITGILTFIVLASAIGWMIYREPRKDVIPETPAMRAEG